MAICPHIELKTGRKLTEVVARRESIHRQLGRLDEENKRLRAEIDELGGLASLGMAWAMTAHEVNNLLTPVGSYAQLAMQHPEDTELARKAAQKASVGCQRISDILERVLVLAGSKEKECKWCCLSEIVDEAFDLIVRDFSKDRIEVQRQVPAELKVLADRVSLRQALMNLILNARQSMQARGGRLRITGYSDNDGVVIEVADTGCGMDKESLSRVFEMFYTTKRAKEGAKGNGIGLAFCKRIIESHNGKIEVESQPNMGTCFKIHLPNSQASGTDI
jgi:signal transduction histidine kinase